MPDVFEVLRQDHEEVKAMLARLETGPTAATGATAGQLEERKSLVEQLVIEESKHETAEEEYFWPAVRELGPTGNQVAEHAVGQETEAKPVLNELDKLSPEDQEFERLLTKFTADALEHIAYEETQAWPLLRASLTAEESSQLGDNILQAKKVAPTRPHPNTPPKEGVLKSAGPAVAAADKLRDKMTGRGEDS
jgi:hemerythrin superfamily protein